jgi:hypothetical protein
MSIAAFDARITELKLSAGDDSYELKLQLIALKKERNAYAVRRRPERGHPPYISKGDETYSSLFGAFLLGPARYVLE